MDGSGLADELDFSLGITLVPVPTCDRSWVLGCETVSRSLTSRKEQAIA